MGEIYRSEAFQNIEVGFVAEQPLHRPVETNQSFCYFETFCNKSTGIARENKKRIMGNILPETAARLSEALTVFVKTVGLALHKL